jgi:hypothetical protein
MRIRQTNDARVKMTGVKIHATRPAETMLAIGGAMRR